MSETGFIADEKHMADIATGYWNGLDRKSPLQPAPPIGESWTYAAGDIVSTVGDLVKWDGALESGRIIDGADFELMTTPVTLTGGKRDDYGFGWWIDEIQGHVDIYHDGDTFGMSSSNNLFSDLNLQIVVLENVANDAASRTMRATLKTLLPSL